MASGSKDKQLPAIAPGPGPLREIRPLTKNKKSSSACLPCKQAKRKCTGRPAPCKACQNTGGDCIFDETLDLRRKVAARRTLGEMEYYRALLYSLLESLRTANDEKLHHILRTIRGGGDLINIASAVEAPFVEALAIEAPSVDASDSSSEYPKSIASADENIVQPEHFRVDQRFRITVEKLCDNPLFQVPCRPWTTVTDDNHLVSHLISLYFTWDHPLMQVVDQEMFLRDIVARNTASEFCSPVLVNSILAVASTYSDFPEVFTVPGDVASRGQHFFMEAERLWKAEEGRPSLANIQALALMSHNLKLQGKDNASWLFLRQAVQLGQDIGMFKSPRTKHPDWDRMPKHIKRASARTAWAIFILNSQMSMESRRTANLEVPRSVLDRMDDLERGIHWIPYPRSNHMEYPSKPALLRYVMAGLADLTETIVDIQDLLFDRALDISIHEVWAEASQLHARLEEFRKSLPDIIEDQPVPQMLFLHMKCYQMTISLLDFLLEHRDFEATLGPSTAAQVKRSQIHAAKQVAQYLRLHREHYGLRQTPGLMFGPVKSSAFTLLVALHDDESADTFIELYQFLVSFSRRFSAAKEAICKIDSIIRDLDIQLPFEIAAVLDHRDSACS